MNKFEIPAIEVVMFEAEEILTASSGNGDYNGGAGGTPVIPM